jgi:hypothetical protein
MSPVSAWCASAAWDLFSTLLTTSPQDSRGC